MALKRQQRNLPDPSTVTYFNKLNTARFFIVPRGLPYHGRVSPWPLLTLAMSLLAVDRDAPLHTLSDVGPPAFTLPPRAWALWQAQDVIALAGLLSPYDTLSGELTHLRAAARAKIGNVDAAVTDVHTLVWGEPDTLWSLATLRQVVDCPETAAALYTAREQEVIRRRIPPVQPGQVMSRDAIFSVWSKLAKDAPTGRLRIEARYAQGVWWLHAQDYPAAIKRLREAERAALHQPTDRWPVLLALGEAERRRGHYTAAMAYFDTVAHSNDAFLATRAQGQAGQMAMEYRRYADAQRLLSARLIASPVGDTRHESLWGLGWVAFRTGDFSAAQRFLRTVQDEAPFGPWGAAAAYWQARATYELGDTERARLDWVALTTRYPNDYYAYRARTSLGTAPWPRCDAPREVETTEVMHVRGLLAEGMQHRVRSALKRFTATGLGHFGPVALQELARAATTVGDRVAATTLSQARLQRFYDGSPAARAVLDQSFGSPYRKLVTQAAEAEHMDPALVLGLVRAESSFRPSVVSPAGALGLLQLLPSTAQGLWQEERHAHPASVADLLEPAVNIRLGVRYLARLWRSFKKHDEYALATYNAGPTAVRRWKRLQGDLPPDLFVEEIPFAETRAYVKRVLAWRGLAALLTPSP